MKKAITGLLMLTFFGSCQMPKTEDKPNSVPEQAEVIRDTAASAKVGSTITVIDFKTKTGRSYSVIEEKSSASISKLSVALKDFISSNDTINIGESDPVNKIFLADLNKDGFEELYILTTSAGSGSGGSIYGLASNKDKSATPIHVQELTEKDIAKGGKFEGYQGHDSIFVQGNLLARQFPVYKDGDNNATPTGGKRTVFYTLSSGEAAWQLTISSTAHASMK